MKLTKVVTYTIEATEDQLTEIISCLAEKVVNGSATPTQVETYNYLSTNK